MPSAKGENWEKYSKKFADDEVEEKKITPLTDEYVELKRFGALLTELAGYSSPQDLWSCAVRCRA